MAVNREWWVGKRKEFNDGLVEDLTEGVVKSRLSRHTAVFRSSENKNS